MDRASQVVVPGVPPSVPNSNCALGDRGSVPHSNLHHHAPGRMRLPEICATATAI